MGKTRAVNRVKEMTTIIENKKPLIIKAKETWTYEDNKGKRKTIHIKNHDLEKQFVSTMIKRGPGLLDIIYTNDATVVVEKLNTIQVSASINEAELLMRIAQMKIQVNLKRLNNEKVPK